MALARFHNLSDLSQPRASSLLQKWREIECENVGNQSFRSKERGNGSDSECVSTTTSLGNGSENGDDLSQSSDDSANHSSEIEIEDNNSVISEQSSDLGEPERQRVRQIFREWMNTGSSKGHSSYAFGLNNRTEQWLGENEHDREKIIDPKIGARRPYRRLYGRQTLLDLLQKAENERRKEVLSLTELRPVSNFVHRNRIQALLRGRFLRNDGLVLDQRQSSVAATELCLLRQRHTVSDLREGFISKLESSAYNSLNTAEPDSFPTDENDGESESTCKEGEAIEPHRPCDLESETHIEWNALESDVQVTYSGDLGEQIKAHNNDESSSEFVDINVRGSHEVYSEHLTHDVVYHSTNTQHNINEEFNSLGYQESAMEIEENASLDHVEEPHDDLQEAIDSWLDMSSEEVETSVERLYSSDDNVRNTELQELLSRRRVSGLLRSGFRHSLDLVLQSHVERLAQAYVDSEMDIDASFPDSIEQNQEHINDDQFLPQSERNSFAIPSLIPSYPLWDDDLLHFNSNQQFETEWDDINYLRLDMARLQQVMNDMKNMLEVCMGMQMELQRSVRHEVSAALNRSIFSIDTSQENSIHDESHLDNIRRGICCLCQDSKIDSLLYRCGHLCTCAKCAEKLVESKGKCPMCQAPAVEAVRAYFLQ